MDYKRTDILNFLNTFKQMNEGILTTLFAITIGGRLLSELLGVLAYKSRSNRIEIDPIGSFRSTIKQVHGPFNLQVENKFLRINNTPDKHWTQKTHTIDIEVDLNTKVLKYTSKKNGFLKFENTKNINLSNADIYNICDIISRGTNRRVDYDNRLNEFTS